jgi:hypothetical protein
MPLPGSTDAGRLLVSLLQLLESFELGWSCSVRRHGTKASAVASGEYGNHMPTHMMMTVVTVRGQ